MLKLGVVVKVLKVMDGWIVVMPFLTKNEVGGEEENRRAKEEHC